MEKQQKKLTVVFNGKKVVCNNKFVLFRTEKLVLKSKTVYKKAGRKSKIQGKYHQKSKKQKKRIFVKVLSGLVIGFINGFWGGGGGMVCVPVLAKILKLPQKSAHATAILIMLPLSLVSGIIYFLNSSLAIATAGYVTAGFFVGGAAGALLLKKMNNIVLQFIFAGVIIVAGVRLLF